MKKYLIIPLLIFSGVFASCTSKKDRLAADTLVIALEPPQIIVGKQTQTTLRAIPQDATGSTDIDITPAWTMDNPSLGTLSPTTGKTVTFYSGTALGTTKVYTQYGSVRASGQITVSDVVTDRNVSAEFDIFREIPMASNSSQFLFDTLNPPTVFGGGLFAWSYPQVDTNTIITSASGALGDDHTEGAKGLKVDIGDNPGGIWFQFGYPGGLGTEVPTDMSSYSGSRIVFDVKTTKDLRFEIAWRGNLIFDRVGNYVPIDGNWHTVSVAIRSMTNGTLVNFSKIIHPFAISSSDTNFSFYIDNIRWEY
ncbi:MAG: hypothetical protein NT145_08010 [Elusimicrobia bacterium]|nr:hypothetical protein [Elusimicrobiota bacterium]